MKTPPLLIAAALLFWGWQTSQIIVAALLALLVEGSRWIVWRWQMQEQDFQRVADLSSVLFVVLVAFQFNANGLSGIYNILQWMPAVLTPLLLAQFYSQQGAVPLSALFASMRRTRGTLLETQKNTLDLSYAFVFACLIAASVGGEHTRMFPFIVAGLLIWALWPQQPRRRLLPLWSACIVAGVGLGLGIQTSLYAAQGWAESMLLLWVREWMPSGTSADFTRTAIGERGRLKLSDRIRLRVQSDAPLEHALLLHEASYSTFYNLNWSTRGAGGVFSAIDPLGDGHTWQLATATAEARRLTITAPLKRDVEVIPLPHGTRSFQGEAILGLQINDYGAVKVDTRPGQISYRVEYLETDLQEPAPGHWDLEIPASTDYRRAFAQIATELPPHLDSAVDKVAAVESFFRDKFTYSLVQRGRSGWVQTPRLVNFLLRDRHGHCEYFASATTLLLRHLGVPARYAVGYAVSEYSDLEGLYIARQRDAHAWVLAHVDGRWRVVDTTPSTWHEEEDAAASAFSVFSDITAWIGYRWSRLRDGETSWRNVLWGILPVLVIALLWRLRHAQRAAGTPAPRPPRRDPVAGLDSEFYQLVRDLENCGLGPLAGETLRTWLTRLGTLAPERVQRWEELLALHYRYRFDPQGLSTDERALLRAGIASGTRTLR